MNALCAHKGWVRRGVALLGLCVLLGLFTACATTTTVVETPPALQSDDDDFSEMIAQLRADLSRNQSREVARTPVLTPTAQTPKARETEFASRAKALFAPLTGNALLIPVVGIRPGELEDSWGNSRDGGKRKHRGIDIFAPKGTSVIAVADGIVSYIGDQPKGGRGGGLTTESGKSFYYAHLDRWASGLYEGMEVHSGDLLGFVGNTGNAKYTPSHLHFAVNENDEMVNPYPILTKAVSVARAHVATESGGALGTR
jgi:murein DD-endopeptidase MepM/ murein hydrolase activator NlpD